MIENDQELAATQQRIAYFQSLVRQLQVTATREEFPTVSSGYRAEIQRMEGDVSIFLARQPAEPNLAEVFAGRIGNVSFDPPDLSENTEQMFGQILQQKQRDGTL